MPKHAHAYLSSILNVCLILIGTTSAAHNSINPAQTQKTDQEIRQLYHSLHMHQITNMAARLNTISKQWLQRPYTLTALGEGIPSDYDEAPRYRTDAFDCETYVDTVLALALATDLVSFKQCIDQIRYAEGHVSYVTRNHFTSLDWNPNNQHQGFIKDITETIVNSKNKPIALQAQALINKTAWYAHASLQQIRLPRASLNEQTQQLSKLQRAGRQFNTQIATIPYLPLTHLFDSKGQAVLSIFKQIPQGAIIEIIRPNWDLTASIGTHINVSHLGFAFWNKGVLFFRQASSLHHQVIDTPLIEYLHDMQKIPTIKGINIQVVLPKIPLTNGCA